MEEHKDILYPKVFGFLQLRIQMKEKINKLIQLFHESVCDFKKLTKKYMSYVNKIVLFDEKYKDYLDLL
jgi:hypothetical protein